MKRWATATIDVAALRHNYAQAKAAARGARALAVIKANAYGHGLVRVAKALTDADGLAVARCHEAVELREAGVTKPILVLEGFLRPEEVEWCSRYRLEAAIHHGTQVRMLEAARLDIPIRIWLKIDTGMHRLGFPLDRVRDIFDRLAVCTNARPNVALMSHLANADDRDDPYTEHQLRTFVAATRGLEGRRSLANSAGVLGWPKTHFDDVRPGIMLYGCSPFADETGKDANLRPVMTLETRLIAMQAVGASEPIGYSGSWRCPKDSRIGVAAIGYGDGYPRHAPSGTSVLVNGRLARLVGRVSMDMICIDLTDHPNANVGDGVIVWGRGLPAEDVARQTGTIAYELLCKVTSRVDFVENEDEGGDGPAR
jgi:alanine racemase